MWPYVPDTREAFTLKYGYCTVMKCILMQYAYVLADNVALIDSFVHCVRAFFFKT